MAHKCEFTLFEKNVLFLKQGLMDFFTHNDVFYITPLKQSDSSPFFLQIEKKNIKLALL